MSTLSVNMGIYAQQKSCHGAAFIYSRPLV